MQNQTSQLQKLINNEFITQKRISAGSFGVVYQGHDINNRTIVAIKIDKGSKDETSLEREAVMLRRLQNVPRIPKLYWAGKEGDSNVLVIQYLGRDLTHYMKTFRKFSLKCVLNIAEQMINIIENIHKNKIIHRDIKPENVLVGRDDEECQLYVVDFGISKFYRDENQSHISYREKQPFIGTTRYASINAHKGLSLSRRDDLESLGYMLIFLLKGQLPWQNIQHSSEEDKIKQVGQLKMSMDMKELCRGIPIEFGRYLDYVRGLPFKSEPNYKFLLQLFRKVSQEHNYSTKDLIFDWGSFQKSEREGQHSTSSNVISSKPSIFKKSKEEIQSGNIIIGSQLNQSGDQELNSLLKTPEQRQSILTPENLRKKSRLQSVSSYNDSISDIDFNNSVMLGIQPSILSRLSKISFNSNSIVRNSRQNISLTPEIKFEKKISITPNPYLEQLAGQKRRKSGLSHSQMQAPPKDDESILECWKMNEGDEGIEKKYMELKEHFLNAYVICESIFSRFKLWLNRTLK